MVAAIRRIARGTGKGRMINDESKLKSIMSPSAKKAGAKHIENNSGDDRI
jgi:hypothetical protein